MTSIKNKKVLFTSLILTVLIAFCGAFMVFAYADDAAPSENTVTESVSDDQITALDTTDSAWTVVNTGITKSDNQVIMSGAGTDYNTYAYYNSAIDTDAVQFQFRAKSKQTVAMKDSVNYANTRWVIRAEQGKVGSYSGLKGYHIILYPERNIVWLLANGGSVFDPNPTANIDVKGKLFDGNEHTVTVGAFDKSDGVHIFVDVDGENFWNYTDALVDGAPRIAKEGSSFCIGNHNEVPSVCEQLNYAISSQEGISFATITDAANITEISTNNASAWNTGNGYSGISVQDGKVVATNEGSNEGRSSLWYNSVIVTDAVGFKFKANNPQPTCGGDNRDDGANTMWTVRAQYGNGGLFGEFGGYHIVLYPNCTTNNILCISNPQISEYGKTTIDLQTLLFDGEEHEVVLGAIDKDDGNVYVFMDVDGENVWGYTDTVAKIARRNTSFCMGHRQEVYPGQELINYAIRTDADYVYIAPEPDLKDPTLTDESKITVLSTVSEAWNYIADGVKVVNNKLVANADSHDHNTTASYANKVVTDAVQFIFQSNGEQPTQDKRNTMWTVRAERGKSGDFPSIKGYHIVMYPNQSKILLITNPDIGEYGATTIDLKKLLFDGEEHGVLVGAIDQDNGDVLVFLDVDGHNVWSYTDTKTKISKTNTTFSIGHRNEYNGDPEQLNYSVWSDAQFTPDPIEMPEYSTLTLAAEDFNKSNWDLYQNVNIADGAIICTSTSTHAVATYAGRKFESKDAVKVQMRILAIGPSSKIAFAFRRDLKDGGGMLWNSKQLAIRFNMTGYEVMGNHDGAEKSLRDNIASGSWKTPLQFRTDYVIEAGTVDTEDGVMIFMYIDGVLQFAVTDTATDKKVTGGGDTTFAIQSYDDSQFVVAPEGAEAAGPNAERDNADLATSLTENDKWANILNAYNPNLKKESQGNDRILTLKNKGGIAYAENLTLSQIDFDFVLDGTTEPLVFMFNKSRRGTYFDSVLQQNEYRLNQGYGIAILANGTVNIFKANQTEYSSATVLKSIWGTDFGKTTHHITVTFAVEKDTNNATIAVFLDNALDGYKAVDPACGDSYRSGYIGFQKMSYSGSAVVTNVRYNGTVNDTTVGKNTNVKNVYLPQFYAADKHDFADYKGKNVLRFSYTKDSDYVKNVTVTVEDELIATLEYPDNVIEIAEDLVGKDAVIKVNSVDGTFNSLTYKLADTRGDYEVAKTRYADRIAVRQNDVTGYAEFYYNDGKTPAAKARRFMPIGHNYLLLKDSWEATSFDASPDVTLNNYDPMETEALLALLAKNSYNSVRFFLGEYTTESIGGLGGTMGTKNDADFYKIDDKQAFYLPYLNNLTDFMTRAQRYGIYSMIVFGRDFPDTEYFKEYRNGISSVNEYYLKEKQIEGKEKYVSGLLGYLKEYDQTNGTCIMNSIFGLSAENESYYAAKQWPFNQTGSVTLANGKTYDMSKLDDRQKAADEGKIYYYGRFVDAIKAIDPKLLACEGMYTLLAVGNYTDSNPDANYGLTQISDSNDAFPTTLDVMMKTKLDFFDVHVYHTTGKELTPVFGENMRSLKYGKEVQEGQARKPLVMAEFGAFRQKCGNDFEVAKQIITDQRDIALGSAYNFQGYLTWQVNEFKQTELFAMLEDDAKFLEGELRYIYVETAELVDDEAVKTLNAGDELSLDGLKVRVNLSNGKSELIPFSSGRMLWWNEDEVITTQAGTQTIEVMFDSSYIFSYDIEVVGSADPVVQPPEETGCGCGGTVGAESALMAFAVLVLALAFTLVRRKQVNK